MSDVRTKRAKLNIIVSLFSQFVTLICGLVVPRLLIKSFGSEAYGATSSVASFLAYITLLEGGIGGVARAALYKPLAENDDEKISLVVKEIQRFFKVIGFIFFFYVIFLAFTFKNIAHVEVFDYASTAILVIVMSISTFAQYFIGISYTVLLQAAQRTYITKLIQTTAIALNAIASVLLVKCHCSLIMIKLVSSLVFALRPLCMWLYVKKEFNLIKLEDKKTNYLKQKWDGLGQHLAYFIHTNTDVAVLTLLVNLKMVTVYAVYNMIVTEILNIASSFSSGMESVFGDMLAKQETKQLNRAFSYYETLLSVICLFLYGVTAVMIVPFVSVYTAKLTDVNYIYPTFGLILVIGSLLHCLRLPYNSMVIAAGHFKQTQIAAYGEAIVNIATSIIAVKSFGLVGVAIGTLCAISFRFIYYVFYLRDHIYYLKMSDFMKRLAVNVSSFVLIYFIGQRIAGCFVIGSYISWMIAAMAVSVFAITIVLGMTYIFYKEDLKPVINKILKRK